MDTSEISVGEAFSFLLSEPSKRSDFVSADFVDRVFETMTELFGSGAFTHTTTVSRIQDIDILSTAMKEFLPVQYEKRKQDYALELRTADDKKGILRLANGIECHLFLTRAHYGIHLYATAGWEHTGPDRYTTEGATGCIELNNLLFARLLTFIGRKNPFLETFMSVLDRIFVSRRDDKASQLELAEERLAAFRRLEIE